MAQRIRRRRQSMGGGPLEYIGTILRAEASGTSTLVVNLNANTAVGDLLVFLLGSSVTADNSINLPAGAESYHNFSHATPSSRMEVVTKIATSADVAAGSVSFTASTSSTRIGVCLTFRNAATQSAAGKTSTGTGNPPPNIPASAGFEGGIVLFAGYNEGGKTGWFRPATDGFGGSGNNSIGSAGTISHTQVTMAAGTVPSYTIALNSGTASDYVMGCHILIIQG